MRGAAHNTWRRPNQTYDECGERENECEKERNGKRVTYVKAQVQPYPVESVEIVEWLLWVEWVDILLVVDWGDFISTPTYTGILERLRHYHRNGVIWLHEQYTVLHEYAWERDLLPRESCINKERKKWKRKVDTATQQRLRGSNDSKETSLNMPEMCHCHHYQDDRLQKRSPAS